MDTTTTTTNALYSGDNSKMGHQEGDSIRGLQGLQGDCNTVFILSDSLKENIKYIQGELPGVALRYEPLSLYHPELLEVFNKMGVGITCSNQELLEVAKGVPWEQDMLIGCDFASNKFIKAAYAAGCTKFAVSSATEMANIQRAVGGGAVEFTLQVEANSGPVTALLQAYPITGLSLAGPCVEEERSALVYSLLDQDQQIQIRSVSLGALSRVGDVALLKDSLATLQSTLPAGTTLALTLGQDLLEGSLFIATRILEKEAESYTVDLSLYDELACYLDTEHDIGVVTSGPEVTGVILGNTGEEDDVICRGLVGHYSIGDWLLLKNIALVDCRGLELVSVDLELRLAEYQSTATEIEQHRLDVSRRQTLPDITVKV